MQYSLSINDCLQVGSVQINVLEIRHDSVKLAILDPNASPSYREETLYIQSDDDADGQTRAFEPLGIQANSRFALPAV